MSQKRSVLVRDEGKSDISQYQAVENSTFAKFLSCDDQSGCFSLLYPRFLSFTKSPPIAMYVNSGMLVSNPGLQNVKRFMPTADRFENT